MPFGRGCIDSYDPFKTNHSISISHLTQLGIEVQGDGGYLFILAMVVFVTSAVVLWMERKNIPVIRSRF